MASMFTGLAFLHGHITNRELLWSLAKAENDREAAKAAEKAAPCPDPTDCMIGPRHAC
ncbi:hypothetical protein EC912_10740 [Luteibacter rhizovicinus]|uniref:Uncharacterized protein n=1 Tax=Luteibacter rhizovicinus TaxID=242606 RepID=A0A4R3YML5_9GAMM|nr:hypothetical protein [Luteibacter rhizovicinus]TCV92334.1 hypothetical protein EC912_10740 [Luteibacter rhizovicinus]